MKSKLLAAGLLMTLLISSCNLPLSAAAPTSTPVPFTATPAVPTQPPLPTNTPLPTDTPPPTLTFTPTVPTITTLDKPVNCRIGPGTAWLPISALNLGQSSQIVGKNSNTSWWFIQDPLNPGRNCWVAASVTSASGNLAGLPVVQTPAAQVTNVKINVNPKSQNLGLLCLLPITNIKLNGTIEVNGPTTVKWNFETQQGGAMPVKTTDFDTFGSKDVSVEYTPLLPAGTYWARLVVTSPSSLFAEANYKIECT